MTSKCRVCNSSINGQGRRYCKNHRQPQKIGGGYIAIHQPDHPRANKGGYVVEHIIVMEKKIGRFLNNGEVVHHVDGNRENNSPDNLMLFNSSADHLRFHALERKHKLVAELSTITPKEWGKLWVLSAGLIQDKYKNILVDSGYSKKIAKKIAEIVCPAHYQLLTKNGWCNKAIQNYRITKEQFISYAMLEVLKLQTK